MASKKANISLVIAGAQEEGQHIVIKGTDKRSVRLPREDALAIGTSIGSTINVEIALADGGKFEAGETVAATKVTEGGAQKVNKKDSR